jgi:16S rRNA (guanine966-N2)-methyltransferase
MSRLRVISGSAGGLFLKSPKRHALRPTQDRIRQVIFSSLAEKISGAHVLDLYAGTGSLGIEALSRGAERAVFVEQEREAVDCIRENLRHCRLEGGDVRQGDALVYLEQTHGDETFDLIFADPPYDKTRGSLGNHPLLAKIGPRLRSKGIIVWEHFAEQRLEEEGAWTLLRHRTYGETGLTFLQRKRENID